jgi:glycopeptide antibiotics resistance protein
VIIRDWHGWVGTFTGVVLITVAVLPLAALVVWVLARRRSVTGTPAGAWRTSLAEVGIVYGTVPWVWMIMLPGSRAGDVPGRVSLLPLRDLVTMSAGQVIGNLLVFAALGFFAPLRFRALGSLPRILALAAGCSVLVETAQYVLQLDRVSSVDDVLLNAAGAGLTALASRRWWRATTRTSSDRLPSALVPREETPDGEDLYSADLRTPGRAHLP